MVFLGKVDHLKEGEGEVMVAVKALRNETSEVLENFVSEANFSHIDRQFIRAFVCHYLPHCQ